MQAAELPRNIRDTVDAPPRRPIVGLLLAWAAVGLPLGWGIFETVVKASQLFR